MAKKEVIKDLLSSFEELLKTAQEDSDSITLLKLNVMHLIKGKEITAEIGNEFVTTLVRLVELNEKFKKSITEANDAMMESSQLKEKADELRLEILKQRNSKDIN